MRSGFGGDQGCDGMKDDEMGGVGIEGEENIECGRGRRICCARIVEAPGLVEAEGTDGPSDEFEMDMAARGKV